LEKVGGGHAITRLSRPTGAIVPANTDK
jgi:hypothetical protein